MAFDPDYATNGRFYTFSIQDEPVAEQKSPSNDPGRVVVRRYRVSAGDPDVADPASAVDILGFDNWSFGHNAGWMAFNPRLAPTDPQYLYIATGDGEDFNDDCGSNCPQLDPDPALVGWARDLRIWAFGLRNPTGTGFDRETGDLYIGDIGQESWEEIDLIPAGSAGGVDLGWRLREGTHAAAPPVGGPKPTGAIDPIYEYAHDAGDATRGVAVLGGYVYRGTIPELQGRYGFGDWLGRVWALTPNPAGDPPAAFDGTNFADFEDLTPALAPPEGFGRLQGFAEDAFGELYILENCDPSEIVDFVCPAEAVDGAVYKIVQASPVPGASWLASLLLAAGLALLGAAAAACARDRARNLAPPIRL
jgi:glucose/arabinose dehydrogenase